MIGSALFLKSIDISTLERLVDGLAKRKTT